jgi:hypothetical protein
MLRDFCELVLSYLVQGLLTRNAQLVLSMITNASDLQIRRSWDDNGVAIWDKYVEYPVF